MNTIDDFHNWSSTLYKCFITVESIIIKMFLESIVKLKIKNASINFNS